MCTTRACYDGTRVAGRADMQATGNLRAGTRRVWSEWVNTRRSRILAQQNVSLVLANMSVTVHLNASVRACMSACMRVCSWGWEARRRAGGQQTTRPAAPLILQSVCGPTRPGRVQESPWARRLPPLVALHRCRREEATTTQLIRDDVTSQYKQTECLLKSQ